MNQLRHQLGTNQMAPLPGIEPESNGAIATAAARDESVMSANFGALPEVQFMHAIFRFEDQEVNDPMIQTVHNLELK